MPVTIRGVARKAGVSVSTVSRVLNDKPDVSSETRARVLAAIHELKYVRSDLARGLTSGKANTIGVLVNFATSPVYSQILPGIEQGIKSAGYKMLVYNSCDDQDEALKCLAIFEASRVQGVILVPVQTDRRDIVQLEKMRMPFVLLYRHFADVETDYVIPDHVEGGYLVTNHLLSLGHRSIGHVTGLPHFSSFQGRLAGYRKAIAEWGVQYDERLVTRSPYTAARGLEAALRLLDQPHRPSAVYAGSTDIHTVSILRAARILGLHIPEDLALGGSEEVELAEFLEVPLTGFRVPYRELGARAAEILIARIEGESAGPQQLIFKPELVVRQSSGVKLADGPGAFQFGGETL